MLEKSGYITLALPYWNIKGNYFSEGKIMKLAKTVIVSGLLFSSVLGSVNVGSITAMAMTAGVNTDALEEIPSTEVTAKPGSVINGNQKEVNVTYLDKDGNKISGENLKTTIPLIDNKKPITVKNLNLPAGFKFKKLEFKKEGIFVILQAISKADVSILFVNDKGALINSGTVLNDRDVLAPISSSDIVSFPKGYEVTPNQSAMITIVKDDNGFSHYSAKIVLKKVVAQPQTPSKRPSNARYTIQRVRITFVDQNSKDLVGYKQVTGKNSFSTKIEAPKNYAFVNEKNATIKFDKSGNKEILVFVKLMTAAPVKHVGVVTTNSGSYKRLYTLEGKMITNRALGTNSQWYTDQYAIVKGEKMYRVATNEWVKASDVK